METNIENEILYNLELQLDEETTISIVIRENDDIEEVINKFCEEHDYNEEIKQIIMNHLVNSIDNDIDTLSDKTNVTQWDSDEEYEEVMNHNVENVLKTKNLSKNNSKVIDLNENNSRDNYSESRAVKDEIVKQSNSNENNSIKLQEKINENTLKLNNSQINVKNDAQTLKNQKLTQKEKISNRERKPVDKPIKNEKAIEKENSILCNANNRYDNIEINNSNSKFDINTKNKTNPTKYLSTPQQKSKKTNYSPDKEFQKSNLSKFNEAQPGERLYNQYMEKLPKKKHQLQKIIEEKVKEEIKEASFMPKILKSSQSFASKSPERSNRKIEDILIQKGNIMKERKIEQSAQKSLKEFENFSFYPEINEKSGIIATFKRKERLEKLSEMKNNKSHTNKSCDITASSHISESIPSDEEKIINKNPNRNFYKQNEKKYYTNLNVNSENSIISSDYTFSNMKLNDKNVSNANTKYDKVNKDLSVNRDKYLLERNHEFSTSHNDLTIRTSRSRTRSKSYDNSTKQISKNPRKEPNRTKTPLNINRVKSKNKSTYSITRQENSTRSKTPLSSNHTLEKLKLNPEKNIHDYLYVESELIKKKKQEKEIQHLKENYPFHPIVNDSSIKLINRQETSTQFINRLYNSKKEAEELIIVAKKRSSLKDQIDPLSGKPYFKPTITRGPLNHLNNRRTKENLEGFYDNKILSEKKKIQEEEMLNNLEKKKLWLERSMKSVLKMKIEKYKEIFDLLDSDKDGFISSRQIRLSALDSDMLTTLTPLLEDLQKKGTKINFKEFCLAVDKFLPIKIFSIKK